MKRLWWIAIMAWRDTRSSRRHLLLYAFAIVLGVAALVSIASFGENLRRALEDQSRALLGADLVVSSSDPFDAEDEAVFTALGGEQAREIAFSSMILFPETGQSRLVSVHAVEKGFPFYGVLKTDPESAAEAFRIGPRVVAEESLLLQFGVGRGSEVQLGTGRFRIEGAVLSVPGESPGAGLVAPRVFLPLDLLEQTDLLRKGSRVTYRVHFRFDDGLVMADRLQPWWPRLKELELSTRTVSDRQRSLGRSYDNLNRFLELIGIVALLLGCVGVASGIHVFIREKLTSVAVLRCLGAPARLTVAVHLVQAAGIGLTGALLGAALAGVVLRILPGVVGEFLVVEVAGGLSGSAVLQGLLVGVGMTVLFALFPLLQVRRVSPLLALRASVEPTRRFWRDPVSLFLALVLLAGVCGFILLRVERLRHGAAFSVGILVTFGLLTLVGWLLMKAARHLVPRRAPYVVRQGLANLHRPNNRTLLVILALGLGTFLVTTLSLLQGMLVGQIDGTVAEDESNMILFDIQPDQRDGVAGLLEANRAPLIEEAPVVTMRLTAINGRTVDEIRKDRERGVPRWVLYREYRSTFRSSLSPTEKLVSGEWIQEWTGDPVSEPVPISLEAGIAEDMKVGLGDRLDFDLQGVPVGCVVRSLREVDWKRVRPNFFVVFPVGPIDAAPWFMIMSTRVADSRASADLQRQLVETYPNVSAIDLRLILETVNGILEKMSLVFRVLSLFTVATGLIVLAGSVLAGRFQRLRENVLLRTLGASRRQVGWIEVAEYALLGLLAAGTGSMLAWFGAWAVGRFVFDLGGLPGLGPALAACGIVPALTVLIGWLTGIRSLNHPPLEVLRGE
ncbi:MAG: FtsX-like permease family protein [Opitutaceae bacterium]